MVNILLVEDDEKLNRIVHTHLFMTTRDDINSKQKGSRIGIDDYKKFFNLY